MPLGARDGKYIRFEALETSFILFFIILLKTDQGGGYHIFAKES